MRFLEQGTRQQTPVVRLWDGVLFGLIIVQALGGLASAVWRSSNRSARHRPLIDLTDQTRLSRSVPEARPSWWTTVLHRHHPTAHRGMLASGPRRPQGGA